MRVARILVAVALLCCGFDVHADRLKDLATLAGVRSNPLIGYGLVVGLSGTGDQTTQAPFTAQSFSNMLKQFGIVIPSGTNFQLKNVAAVSVHANLPAFIKPGQPIDVTVSSVGNAKSLRGGSLLMTTLKGADGQVYALAQGELVVGGFGADGADGSKVQVNIPSAGRIPSGAIVEREVPNTFAASNGLVFNLKRADFTTAKEVAEAINDKMGAGVAQAVDAMSIRVTAPQDTDQRVSYVSLLENMQIKPGEAPARVVINSRTGTIVVGNHVVVSPGGGNARQLDRHSFRKCAGESAECILWRTDGGDAAIECERQTRKQQNVRIEKIDDARTNRARGQSGWRRAGRFDGDYRSLEGSGRAQCRAGGDLNAVCIIADEMTS